MCEYMSRGCGLSTELLLRVGGSSRIGAQCSAGRRYCREETSSRGSLVLAANLLADAVAAIYGPEP